MPSRSFDIVNRLNGKLLYSVYDTLCRCRYISPVRLGKGSSPSNYIVHIVLAPTIVLVTSAETEKYDLVAEYCTV